MNKDGVLYFSGDGKYRSKIGLSPQRAKTVLGSYDAVNGVLTLVQYNKPEGVQDYVNSMWQIQDQPFRGDVVNSYNDGPTSPGGKPLGPFYELETSSPADGPGPGPEPSPHASHGSLCRQRGPARPDCAGDSRSDHRPDQVGLAVKFGMGRNIRVVL